MLHNKLINQENFNAIFTNLAEEYERLGGEKDINIYLVGGSAILLRFTYRLSTIDVDAFYHDDDILDKAIKSVSQSLDLPLDWLNHDFVNTPSFSPKLIDVSHLYTKYGSHIFVFSLEPKYLIAMKLKSSRPTGGDMEDIIMMIYELRYNRENITYDDVIAAYNELYKDTTSTYRYFFEKTKEAFEAPVEDFEYLFNK